MTFDELLEQIIAVLQRDGGVTYRALKRRFGLDDDYLTDLCSEIIKAKRLAMDEDGEVLVWTGASPVPDSTFHVSSSQPPTPNPQFPIAYTPLHLAERIRAEQSALEARGSPEGEPTTITAFFVDVKATTALIEDLDPEAARRLI